MHPHRLPVEVKDDGRKMLRAGGGCLGTGSRRRARQAAKIRGEGHTPLDPRAPEWENPAGLVPGDPLDEHIVLGRATGGTETSKYPEEEKSKRDSPSSGERTGT